MAQYRPYDTQWLTRASFEPTAGRRIRKRLVLAVAVLVPLIVMAARSGYVDQRLSAPLRLAEMQRDVAGLTAEIERTRMELEMERATRTELQRQAAELSTQVNELTQQLEFLTSRNVQARQSN